MLKKVLKGLFYTGTIAMMLATLFVMVTLYGYWQYTGLPLF